PGGGGGVGAPGRVAAGVWAGRGRLGLVSWCGWRGCRGCRPGPPSRSRSAGLVALEAAAPQPIAAFAVADAAFAAGAVAGQAPAGAAGARLGPARDDGLGGCEPGQVW